MCPCIDMHTPACVCVVINYCSTHGTVNALRSTGYCFASIIQKDIVISEWINTQSFRIRMIIRINPCADLWPITSDSRELSTVCTSGINDWSCVSVFTYPLVTSGPWKMGFRSITPDPSSSEHAQGLPESTLQGICLDEGHLVPGVLKHPDTAMFCN